MNIRKIIVIIISIIIVIIAIGTTCSHPKQEYISPLTEDDVQRSINSLNRMLNQFEE